MLLRDPLLNDQIRSLDTAALRHKVTANNIANLNTPYFKRSFVPFEEEFVQAGEKLAMTWTHPRHNRQTVNPSISDDRLDLSRTNPRHYPGKTFANDPRVIKENITTRRTDQSNVDLDQEMLDLVTNQLRYNTLIQQVSGRFATMRYIINDGRA